MKPSEVLALPMPLITHQDDAKFDQPELHKWQVEYTIDSGRRTKYADLGLSLAKAEAKRCSRGDEPFATIGDALSLIYDDFTLAAPPVRSYRIDSAWTPSGGQLEAYAANLAAYRIDPANECDEEDDEVYFRVTEYHGEPTEDGWSNGTVIEEKFYTR